MGRVLPDLAAEHWVAVIVAGLSMMGVVVAAFLAALAGWLKARADTRVAVANAAAQEAVTKAQIDQQIDQRLAAEVERMDGELRSLRAELSQLRQQYAAKMAAVGRVFTAISRQWSHDRAPDIDPADIALLEDTIPPQWVRRRRAAPPLVPPGT